MPRIRVTRRDFVRLTAMGGLLATTSSASRTALAGAAPAAQPAAGGPVKGGELRVGLYRTFDNLDPAVYWGPPETMAT